MSSRQAVLAKLAAIEAARFQNLVHLNIPKACSNEQTFPVIRNRPPASKPEFEHFEQIERFEQTEHTEHVCVFCGRMAHYGTGVSLRAGEVGTWFCVVHRPAGAVQ